MGLLITKLLFINIRICIDPRTDILTIPFDNPYHSTYCGTLILDSFSSPAASRLTLEHHSYQENQLCVE